MRIAGRVLRRAQDGGCPKAGLLRRRWRFPPDLARRLVLAQADENRVTKKAIIRPTQIGDFGDQFGPEPMNLGQLSSGLPNRLSRGGEVARGIFLIASGWRRLCSVASVFWLMPVPTRPA